MNGMDISELHEGQRVYRFVFTGGGGNTEVDNQVLTVVKVAKVRAKVRTDQGSEGWIHPSDLYPLEDE